MAALLASACGLFTPFDDFDTSGRRTFAVRGDVEGIEAGMVSLSLNGSSSPIVVGNGRFELPDRVAEGDGYVVLVAGNAPGHACSVERAAGTIADHDIDDVHVRCLSGDATLESLTLSSGDFAPTFAKDVLHYTSAAPTAFVTAPTMITVTAKTTSPSARISVNGVAATSGSPSAPIALRPGNHAITVAVSAADPSSPPRRYVIDVRGDATTYVKSTDAPQQASSFGTAIALADDTLVVGAPYADDPAAKDAGAVFVYRRSASGSWAFEAKLVASTPQVFAQLGSSVAVSGDTIVAGARFAPSAAEASGAAYVFRRTNGTWTEEALVKASNVQNGAFFGTAVAISGDTMVIGANGESCDSKGINQPQNNTSAFHAGAVYVFTRNGTTWTQDAYLKASNTRAQYQFGEALALDGDTLAVGSKEEASKANVVNGDQTDATVTQSGAVYIFTRSGGTWTQQAYVKPTNNRLYSFFGASVALSKDSLAVGAPGDYGRLAGINPEPADDMGAPYAGAAYVFTRSGSTWTQQVYLKSSNTAAKQELGWHIAIEDDVLAVGAEYESGAGPLIDGDPDDQSVVNSGAAFLFERRDDKWSQRAYVKASNPRSQATFGGAIALRGGLLAVAAPGEPSAAVGIDGDQDDKSLPFAGAVYLYR